MKLSYSVVTIFMILLIVYLLISIETKRNISEVELAILSFIGAGLVFIFLCLLVYSQIKEHRRQAQQDSHE